MSDCTKLTHCLACGSSDLKLQLDLGTQALANEFVPAGQTQNQYPLAVNRCQHCNHLQLTHVVDPSLIYTHYLYVSGTSQTGRDHFDWFAQWTLEYMGYWPESVLDIGCNDGTQLDYYKKLGLVTYGVDPAENLHKTSSKNHNVYCRFFDDETAVQMRVDSVYADIVVAQNSFAHNPDPLGYLNRLKQVMNPNGLFFVQTSQADMVLNNEFDTIYHEHVNFYNINSMNELCKRAGMHLVDVIKTPIHGTSYIFVISPSRGRPQHIKNLIAAESSKGLMSAARYDEWAQRVEVKVKMMLIAKLKWAKDNGYAIVGYGAAAKGNTLLNYIGGRRFFDAIIDDNPLKQGLVSPGSHIPVVSIDYLDAITEHEAVLFVPLAWNFFNEIKTRILAKRDNPSDLFVRYFPEVKVEDHRGL